MYVFKLTQGREAWIWLQDLRRRAGEGSDGDAAEWGLIKEAHAALEAAGEQAGPLQQLCRGGGLALDPPPKPQGKSPELQARLDHLAARLEQQRYDAMVHDVTRQERAAAAAAEGGLQTYKQQMSFGLHIILMMAAFYAFGHLAGMAITQERAWHPLIGLVFMFGVMVLETSLYVLRTTVPPKLHWQAARRAQRGRAAEAAARLRTQGGVAERQGPRGGAAVAAAAGGSGASAAANAAAQEAQLKDRAAKKED
eukprot:scaffold3.g6653.t1